MGQSTWGVALNRDSRDVIDSERIECSSESY